MFIYKGQNIFCCILLIKLRSVSAEGFILSMIFEHSDVAIESTYDILTFEPEKLPFLVLFNLLSVSI